MRQPEVCPVSKERIPLIPIILHCPGSLGPLRLRHGRRYDEEVEYLFERRQFPYRSLHSVGGVSVRRLAGNAQGLVPGVVDGRMGPRADSDALGPLVDLAIGIESPRARGGRAGGQAGGRVVVTS